MFQGFSVWWALLMGEKKAPSFQYENTSQSIHVLTTGKKIDLRMTLPDIGLSLGCDSAAIGITPYELFISFCVRQS